MLKAMVFDAGGVLLNKDVATAAALQRELGLTDEQMDDMHQRFLPLLGAGLIDEARFWQKVSDAYGTRTVSVSENVLGGDYAKNLVINQELYAYIDKLKTRSIRIAMLSDTIPPHVEAMREAGMYGPFDNLFFSCDIGLRKPDPAIYRYVLSKLELSAAEVGFTDDLETNVTAARAQGMKAVQFRDTQQFIADTKEWFS
jgi:putative hydrolase of the HAD superfamily